MMRNGPRRLHGKSNENSDANLLTKTRQSTGPEMSGPRRTAFGWSDGPAVNSSDAITFENKENFRRHGQNGE